MIQYIKGNLFESDAEAIVNTVNTVGVMGKGVALQFKNQYPDNNKLYIKACRENEVKIGKMFVTEGSNLISGRKIIINFPTKTDWRKPSEYSYIELGLKALAELIVKINIKSIALPPIGAGNGGLDWNNIKTLIDKYLSPLGCKVFVYEPNTLIQEAMRKERAKLTPARAMLLAILYDLVRSGEFVSEFAAEKVAYFLQRFGAKEYFKLDYKPNFYGPYSGKVKYVLYYLNGSYISGYSAMDKKPFEELDLVFDAEKDVIDYLEKEAKPECKIIVERTKDCLNGFYTPFGLELLSTIDFIMTEKHVKTSDEIACYLADWSDRKKTMFNNNKYISLAVEVLESKFATK